MTTRTCDNCGKAKNALQVHRIEGKPPTHWCVDCITGGKPLAKSVVLWTPLQAEVMSGR